MIMGGDKKKMASIIVERFGKPKGEQGAEKNEKAFGEMAAEPESDMDEGLMSGAEEIISAVNGKDAKRLAMALKDFYSMCDDDAPEEEENPEEEPSKILG